MINPLSAALICSLGWGVSPIFEKIAMNYMSPILAVALLGVFFGIFALFILGGLYLQNNKSILNQITNLRKGILNIFIAAFFIYVIGTLFFCIALGSSYNTNLVILITYVLPILIALVLSCSVLKSKVNNMMIFGIVITLIGILITFKYKENS